ncbi:MAG: GNAT family N-acetyltransferase [Sedimentisphaerales bacterium]|nr:GNAT family N-acetyltransferase [Sedimentisphaerales bacterium]
MPTWPRLRLATNADCEPVRTLVFTVLAEYGLKPDPACTDADLRDIEESYFNRGGVFYVLEAEDNSVIGSYGLYPVVEESPETGDRRPEMSTVSSLQPTASSLTCELRKMYLHRDHRGKGLGKRLLEHALSEARRLGFATVTLETASVLKEAIRLYERYGFQPYHAAHLSRRCDQAYSLKL